MRCSYAGIIQIRSRVTDSGLLSAGRSGSPSFTSFIIVSILSLQAGLDKMIDLAQNSHDLSADTLIAGHYGNLPVAAERSHYATRFLNHQNAGRRIPGRQVHLPETVEAA